MTLCVFRKVKSRRFVRIEGHAGYGGPDGDIVCAGVSALAYALVETVLQYERNGALINVFTKMEGGNVKAEWSAEPWNEKISDTLYDTIGYGLELMAERYPDHVRVER